MSDDLGDRMKVLYEAPETSRKFLPMLPVYARIDGRGFSKFTKGMRRPYDERMIAAMVATTKHLVAETGAVIGYTQSDEISLLWYTPDIKSEMMFDRKIQKLVGVLAGLATAAFWQAVQTHFEDHAQWLARTPHFDARVFALPSLAEAANAVLWRCNDATKNSVSMAAHSQFSHKSLHGVGGAAMQERLFQEAGINFNDYPPAFKQGTFVRRKTCQRMLTETERARIPEDKRPEAGCLFTRSSVEEIDVPVFAKVINRVGFLFHGEEPKVAEDVCVID